MDNKVLTATIWYTVGNILAKGMGFLTTPLFTRLLTKDEYGICSNFYAWLSIITIVSTLCLSSSLVSARFDYKSEIFSYIKSNLLLSAFSTFVIFLSFLCWEKLFCKLLALDYIYIYILLASVLVSPAYDMFIQILQFEYKYKIVVLFGLLCAVSNVVFSIIFMYFFEDKLFARILGGQLPSLLIGCCLYTYFLKKGDSFSLKHIQYSLPICIPYMFHLLSGVLLSTSDRTMIMYFCGKTDTAVYGIAYTIAMIVTLLWNAMNGAFSPWLGEKIFENKLEDIRKCSYGYIVFFIVCSLGMMIVAPEILYILGGKQYIIGKNLIPPIIMGHIFLFLYGLYVNIEQYMRKTKTMAIATILCAILNVGLNWYLLPRFGYVAAAYTTALAYFFLLVFNYCVVRIMGLHICYDTKFILKNICISIIFSVLAFISYDIFIIRTMLLISLLAIFILILRNRNSEVKNICRNFIGF